MPLAVWRYPAKTYSSEPNQNANLGSTFMMRNCDPNSAKFGLPARQWWGGEVPNVSEKTY